MKQYKPKEIMKFLIAYGRTVDHISCSHHTMYHESTKRRTTVPVHKKDIPLGTLMAILRQTGLSKDDLLSWKKK